MLTKLSYSVTFPTTGRTLAGEFEFKPGFGLITGANEQGKSLIIEVVRWCLFGSSALRGKAEDYRTLKATLGSRPGTRATWWIGPTRRRS
jgi:predicted ATPase